MCSFLVQMRLNFFDWCKTVNILQEKYFPHKYNKKCHFFYKKMWRAGLLKLKFFMKIKEANRKKHLKIIFFTVQPFIVKMQFEIYKYFWYSFIASNIWCAVMQLLINLSLNLFTSSLQPACSILSWAFLSGCPKKITTLKCIKRTHM